MPLLTRTAYPYASASLPARHDNRLCLVLVAGLRPRNDGAGGSWLRCRLDQRVRHPAGCLGQHTTEGEPQGPDLLQSPSLTGRVTCWIGSSVRLSNASVSPPAMTSSPPTTSPSSNLLRSGFGCAIMSPRPRRVPHRPCRGDERHRSVGSSSPSCSSRGHIVWLPAPHVAEPQPIGKLLSNPGVTIQQ